MDNARDASAEKREVDSVKPGPPAATPEELEITRAFLSIAYQYDREAEDREADERGGRRSGLFLVFLLIMLSFVFFRPTAGANWIWWSAHLGRLAVIGWLLVELCRAS